MKIGYYVQGGADEAVVQGLADRWCPGAEFAAGPFRGSSGESFRREIGKALFVLKDSGGRASPPQARAAGCCAGPGHQPYCPFDTRSNESRTSSRSTPVSTSSSFLT